MFQQVILAGRLGKDPELKETQSGKKVAAFSVATEDSYKDNSGTWQKKTEWHNVVVWGNRAETVAQYLSKGSAVVVVGRLQTRSWGEGDEKKYRTEIVADRVQFLDKKAESKEDKDDGDIPF